MRAHDPGVVLPQISSKTVHSQFATVFIYFHHYFFFGFCFFCLSFLIFIDSSFLQMLKKVRDTQGVDWSTTSAFFRRGILLKRNLSAPVWAFMDIFGTFFFYLLLIYLFFCFFNNLVV